MKSLLFFRRSALLALFFAASLTACKKSNSDPAPAPDLASRVAGQYTLSEIVTGGTTYKASDTNLKGGINVTRQTSTTISMQLDFRLKSTDETYADGSADNVTVSETGGGNIELLNAKGIVIAKVNNNKISVVGDGPDGKEMTLISSK